jgi:hypothetical protein
MVLIRIPEQLAQRRRASVAARTDQGLAARAEELYRNREGLARETYDRMVRAGYSRQQASNVAQSVERGQRVAGAPGVGITVKSRDRTQNL